jgi:hypothetical protein
MSIKMSRLVALEAIALKLSSAREPVVTIDTSYDSKSSKYEKQCLLCGAKDNGRPRVFHAVDCPWICARRITGGK